jgi:hypothetical protein
VGERTLQRAGNLIRDLIADEVVSPETSDILETVLVGIDYEPTEPERLFDFLASVQPAHA